MFCYLSHRLIKVKVKLYEILTYIAFSVPLEVHYSKFQSHFMFKIRFHNTFLDGFSCFGSKKGFFEFQGYEFPLAFDYGMLVHLEFFWLWRKGVWG